MYLAVFVPFCLQAIVRITHQYVSVAVIIFTQRTPPPYPLQ